MNPQSSFPEKEKPPPPELICAVISSAAPGTQTLFIWGQVHIPVWETVAVGSQQWLAG